MKEDTTILIKQVIYNSWINYPFSMQFSDQAVKLISISGNLKMRHKNNQTKTGRYYSISK